MGFDLVGFAPAEPSAYAAEFDAWLAAGYHAGMSYMARRAECRANIAKWYPAVRAVIMVAVNYYVPIVVRPGCVRIARYALGRDYHRWLKRRVILLGRALPGLANAPVQWRPFVDAAPILERELAERAGLGWIGKNAMLINPRIGSYLLLGGLAIDMAVPPDPPMRAHCGTCTRCMDACPTGAIVRPHVVDARRCIAYHTIESRAPIPGSVAVAMGDRLFGCDICQEVCPMNREPGHGAHPNLRPSRESTCQPRPKILNLRAHELVNMEDEDIRDLFAGTPVLRATPAGIRRSAAAVLRVHSSGSA